MLKNHGNLICGTEDEIMEAIREKERQKPCDAISREAVLEYLKANSVDSPDYHEAIEHVLGMPSVIPSSQFIEDIKADIEAARYGLISDGLDVALSIIDKHIEDIKK